MKFKASNFEELFLFNYYLNFIVIYHAFVKQLLFRDHFSNKEHLKNLLLFPIVSLMQDHQNYFYFQLSATTNLKLKLDIFAEKVSIIGETRFLLKQVIYHFVIAFLFTPKFQGSSGLAYGCQNQTSKFAKCKAVT